ncbi:MAG: polyphosphate polymerase domain-containing protein [Coprococcus sp.]
MNNQMIFKRYEIKYMLTREQKAFILSVLDSHMTPDEFGRSTIRNIYFDTDTYRLIRQSIEKPAYKEKLRIRSYQRADADDLIFMELKKKYRSVVYKRRILLPQDKAIQFIRDPHHMPEHSQIAEEIAYFCEYYQTLHPAVYISYEREAFYSRDDSDFRVTFDENILSRTDRLSLSEEPDGTPLLPDDLTIMEVKTSGGMPLWMTHCLTNLHVYKTSFSKYGTAYQKTIFHYDGGQYYA